MVPDHGKELKENDPRIIIPMRNKQGNLIGYQGRTLLQERIRYITIKLDDVSPKVYGLNLLDETKPVRVLEGPFDSMFVLNAMATCDSNLAGAADYLDKNNLVLIPDKDTRNKEVLKQINKFVVNNFKVCLLPKYLNGKDINDIVLNDGLTTQDIECIIQDNTYQGLRAQAEFLNWKDI